MLASGLSRIANNLSDILHFGPQFLRRHFSRLTSVPVPVTIPGIGKVHLRPGESDIFVVRQVFKEREYEVPERGPMGARIRKRYEAILSSGHLPVIVDAGANIGASSLWFAAEYPGATVVAVEPETGNVAALRKNSFKKSSIVVVPAAIGGTAGFVSTCTAALGWGTTTARSDTGIPVITMADAFHLVHNGQPFLAKIDIEGFEQDLFSKNLGWLDTVCAVFIEPHDWLMPGRMTSKAFQQAFAQRNFELLIKGEKLLYVRADL